MIHYQSCLLHYYTDFFLSKNENDLETCSELLKLPGIFDQITNVMARYEN